MMPEEEWRPIAGPWGDLYQVSSLGRVRSLPRRTRDGRRLAGRILNPATAKRGGYLVVSLKRDGIQKTRPVHILVCEAFTGPRPEGMVARHKNGDPLDARAVNLHWGTQRENMLDAVEHGRNRRANQETCMYGHPLEGRNLRPSVKARGRRGCRACHRADETARYRGTSATQQDRDAHYADILAGIDRRRSK